jgi:hypothetical protein
VLTVIEFRLCVEGKVLILEDLNFIIEEKNKAGEEI